ncbi:hypothetical protein [Dokdonella sp.]|uniref:BACON domain-containing protein n=1 Tax=Dokdonella sp. TaxID=2291710 RepID=UPI001B086BEB|nr:hypothetical protein [Dokdonella sp.]MBO9662908.1 hypothetical protein [Dokdonella sp.]
MRSCKLALPLLLLFAGGGVAHAASPTCTSPETKLSWPQTNPIWEMCWLPPSESVGGIGSGMELRKVYFKGHLVFVRAHAPMLFAEYKDGAGGDCYRDWKNENSPLLADRAVQNKLGIPVDPPAAIASCDRSHDPTMSYEICPYQLSGYPNATATCGAPFAIEDNGDHVVLTTQYRADWYMYASRWTFWNDGRIQPSFGFGNRNGTFNNVTHWHHNYWRMEFAIDDAANTVSVNGVDKTTEFSDLRNATGGPDGGPKTWEVRNPTTGNGYKLIPGTDDYLVPANQSGRGFHRVDVMATQQHDDEYADIVEPEDPWEVLGICNMEDGNLVNNESLVGTRPALYYRVAVRDSTANNWPPGCTGSNCIPQDSMICKKVGPTLMPFGPWVSTSTGNPTANVTSGDLDVSLTEGTTATDMFGLGNTGDPGSTLTYTVDTAPSSCASPGAVAWLSAAPASGSVAQGATTTITATVDATTLTAGDYSAVFCVHSNDTAHPTIEVPVSATVSPAASTDPTAVTSGDVEVSVMEGASATDTFDLGNTGAPGSTLAYTIDTAPSSCASPAAVPWLSAAPASGSVAQGATTTITATVDATTLTPGDHSALLCVHSNDPVNATIEVPVSAAVSVNDVIFENGFEVAAKARRR